MDSKLFPKYIVQPDDETVLKLCCNTIETKQSFKKRLVPGETVK